MYGSMNLYTVKQLAELAGVSIRTLHHYDEIGLLKPATIGQNGYRYYGRDELLRLQQILFHRELGFPLESISEVLDQPDFDRLSVLRRHRERVTQQQRRYRQLLHTLDHTLAALEGDGNVAESELYRGFTPETQAEYEEWLVARYSREIHDALDSYKKRIQSWGKEAAEAFYAAGDAIDADLAAALANGRPADSEPVLTIMARHYAWVSKIVNKAPSASRYRNMGQLYLRHPEFLERYETRAQGLTQYVADAISAYCDIELGPDTRRDLKERSG